MIARFSGCTFDARRRQVMRDDGTRVHLTPKAFDLLRLLLENAPNVVIKRELHDKLWPNTFVSDATLASVVKEVRRALGDTDKTGPLIDTCYGIGYAFSGRLAAAEPPATPAASIAVLPFENLGQNSEDAYFSDGLTEEIITALTQRPGFRVAARSSSFAFRGRHEDLKRVGQVLGVDRVLEGTVRRVGGRLRITARLVNVADGHNAWSERYDREVLDVFAVQDDITRSIVAALVPAVAGAPPPGGLRHTGRIDAFELYLRGRYCWHQRTPESLQTAIAHFEAAIALDTDYALAYAGLADSYSALAFYGYLPVADARSAADRAVSRALTLAPGLAECHYAAALFALWMSPDWTAAENPFQRALEIRPDFSPAHTHYAAFLAAQHEVAAALEHLRQAVAFDPLSPAVYGTGALCLFTSGDCVQGRRYAERALELQTDFAVGLYALGLIGCRTGDFDTAVDAFDRLLPLSNQAPYFVGWAVLARALAGRQHEAQTLAASIGNGHLRGYVHGATHVLLGIAAGDRAATARALEAYASGRFSGFPIVHIAPFLDSWAGESSFAEMLGRLHVLPVS